MTDASKILDKILPAHADCTDCEASNMFASGYNEAVSCIRQRLIETYGKEWVGIPNMEEILGAVARGWCSEKEAHKVMDADLAMDIAESILKGLTKKGKCNGNKS